MSRAYRATTVGAGIAIMAILGSAATDAQAASIVQDPAITPGSASDTGIDAVCKARSQWTPVPADARTEALKAYHIDPTSHEFHVVRVIPPSWGGDATVKNLLPMSPDDDRDKARLAAEGHREICSGKLDLAAARTEISTDWRAMLQRLCPTRTSCRF